MNRRKLIKSLGILSLVSLLPKFSFGSWASLAPDQLVNGTNLQDAVNNGIFTLKYGQIITKTDRIVLRSEANAWLNIESISNDDRGVRKLELVSSDSSLLPLGSGVTNNNKVVACGAALVTMYYSYRAMGYIEPGDIVYMRVGLTEVYIPFTSAQGCLDYISYQSFVTEERRWLQMNTATGQVLAIGDC